MLSTGLGVLDGLFHRLEDAFLTVGQIKAHAKDLVRTRLHGGIDRRADGGDIADGHLYAVGDLVARWLVVIGLLWPKDPVDEVDAVRRRLNVLRGYPLLHQGLDHSSHGL